MKIQHNLLIIGGGLVGMYAASLAKNKGLSPLLIEASPTLGGQPTFLYPHKEIVDLPSIASILGSEVVNNSIHQLHQWLKDEEIMLNTQLTKLVYQDNAIVCHLSNNEVVEVKYVILATGNGFFAPNLLEVPGAKDHPHIHYLVNDQNQFKNKHIVVLGGGDSAVDLANNLSKDNRVTIIHRRDMFRANGENVEQLAKNKVEVILNALCDRVEDNTLIYHDKVTNEEKSIKFDEMLVQYGQKYNNNLKDVISDLKVDETNRFVVDRIQQTNLKNIFAVGNCCNYENRVNLISLGYGEAAIAVMYIANKEHDYH